ncbi:MAG: flagellar basal-body MS-ring/collar protein FliF [Pseudomonadota bacterium]
MDQIVSTWQKLDLRRRIVLIGAVLLTLVAVLSLAQIASRPGMALLYSGLDPAAAGEVVGALEQMNVPSEIRGDAIYVPEGERDRVRLNLARDGLPRQGQAGYELLDQISGFSATSDMFNAAYWRAKEGELARTILAAPGVRAARVHIAVPDSRPFARDGAGPTASVTVTMGGGALTPEQATAMRFLTALAVPNLSPDQVAVIDSQAGMVLAPGSETPLANANSQALEREAKLKHEIEALLAARVGRDRARVSVTVETDREARTITERLIQPDSRVTISTNVEEISSDAEGSAGNVTVASNLPAGDADGQNQRRSTRTESREQSNFDYSEIRRETVRQPGAIRRISVAVLVDGITTQDTDGNPQWQPRAAEELTALRQLVIAAIGFDEERGDIVTVESMAFQPDATPGALVEVSPIVRFLERNAMTLIQLGFLAIVALVLALTVIKPLLTRRPPEEDPVLAEFGGALTAEQLAGLPSVDGEQGAEGEEGAIEDITPPSTALRQVVQERPDDSLVMLKEWLADPAEEEVAPQKEVA